MRKLMATLVLIGAIVVPATAAHAASVTAGAPVGTVYVSTDGQVTVDGSSSNPGATSGWVGVDAANGKVCADTQGDPSNSDGTSSSPTCAP